MKRWPSKKKKKMSENCDENVCSVPMVAVAIESHCIALTEVTVFNSFWQSWSNPICGPRSQRIHAHLTHFKSDYSFAMSIPPCSRPLFQHFSACPHWYGLVGAFHRNPVPLRWTEPMGATAKTQNALRIEWNLIENFIWFGSSRQRWRHWRRQHVPWQ